MNDLFNLKVVRSKLVIEQVRDITTSDLVPVRETLNSIDFILGNDDSWEYKSDSKGCVATSKIRLFNSKEILQFIEENKDQLNLRSIDLNYLSDLTQVFKIVQGGASESEIKKMDLEAISREKKEEIVNFINQVVEEVNLLAQTMGDIL